MTEFGKITPANPTEQNVMPETLTTLALANWLEIDKNRLALAAVSTVDSQAEPQTVPAKAGPEEIFALQRGRRRKSYWWSTARADTWARWQPVI
jgi:hypothetical protein